ncbi:hypothetical protein NDA14_007011 [Ustilago hordei]|nr:hypothetical protein NDA14_007011 [Ustilago hordei]
MCRARLNSVGTDVAVSLVIVCLLVAMRKGNAKGQCERATGVLDVTATNQALTAKLPIKSIACGWKAISKKPTRLRERQG